MTDLVDILAIVLGKELIEPYKAANITDGVGLTICCVAKGSQPEVLRSSIDEESLITPECLQGIATFLSNNPSAMSLAQGEIRYNLAPFPDNLMSATFDSSRTGGDLGRFRFQAQLVGRCLIGLHGSFLLTSRELEDLISFDSSPLTSVTEDAMFALKATERGAKLHWLQSYIRECSPQTIADFLSNDGAGSPGYQRSAHLESFR